MDPTELNSLAAQDAELTRSVRWRAVLLLILTAVLLLGTGGYLMWARGVFEPTQPLFLIADDSDGVSVGMNLTFSGFPIGRVRSIRLAQDGTVRIRVDVNRKDAHWLRLTSVFTLERGIVGAAKLRAFTGEPDAPELPPDAIRSILLGDVSAEIPRVVADVRAVLHNLWLMTAPESNLNATLAETKTLAERLSGQGAKGGLVAALTGNPADAERAGQILTAVNTLVTRLNRLTAQADTQVFGRQGLVAGTRQSVTELNAALQQVRTLLQQSEATMRNLRAVSADVRAATPDLVGMRAQIETDLDRVDAMLAELQQKWPFAAKDQELKLP